MNSLPPVTFGWPLLLVGFGNTLRQDDGVGPRLVETIGEMNLPDVRALAVPQLSPEHAAELAECGEVVFVDASLNPEDPVHLRPVAVGDSPRVSGHALEPATLLALTREAYGRAPRAWLLTIPGRTMEFGEEFSPEATIASAEALRVLDRFVQLRIAARAMEPEMADI